MESAEQYVANYLQKMAKYPEYVKSSLVFYRNTYGQGFVDNLSKLMAKAKK
jgi:hypothetical protein